MAASLPYPALHATHGGIWIAHGRRRGCEAVGRGEAIARAAETPMIMLNAPLVGQPARLSRPVRARPARAVRLRPSGALRGADAEGARRMRSASPRRRATTRPPRFLREAADGAARDARQADWPEREGAWASAQSLVRLRWPWARRGRRAAANGPSATSAGCSRAARMGGERRPAAAAPGAARRRPRRSSGSSG